MDKKKIGASVGILAAVSIGATAYASTFHNSNDNNLADQVSYETQVSSDTYRKYDNLAKKTAKKSKYTKDVKGTKVGGEKREKKYEVKEVDQTPAVTTSYEQPTIEYVDQTDYDEDQEVADVEDNIENEVSNDIVTLYVNVDLLNVRNTPDLTDDSNIVDVLNHGDKVTGYLQDGWLVTEDGSYIYADFLTSDKLEYEEIEVEDNLEDYVGWVNVDQLIVRDRPSEDGEYIDVFEQGTKVEGLLKDGWVEFDYYGQKAYVNQSYLSDTEVLTKLEEEKLEKEEAEKKAQEEAEKKAQQEKEEAEKKAQEEAEKEAQLEENESVEEDAVETWADSGYISYDVVNVRSSKDYSSDSNIIGYLYLNNEVSGQSDGNWLEIDLDGQKGYVSLSCISDNPTEVKEEADKSDEEEKEEPQTQENTESSSYEFTGWVNTTSLNVRSGRGTGYSIIDAVYQGDKLSGVVKDGWLEFDHNGQTGYVNVDYLADYEVEPVVIEEETEDQSYEEDTSSESDVGSSYAPEASANGWAAASIAESLVGMPYVWGASSPSVGFDCSGLTSYVYSQLGVNISRSSYQQINNGYAVDASNLQPGDLVFFSYGSGVDHVGMIVGSDGTFVHASSPGVGVVYGNVYSSHYQSVFVGARRIF